MDRLRWQNFTFSMALWSSFSDVTLAGRKMKKDGTLWGLRCLWISSVAVPATEFLHSLREVSGLGIISHLRFKKIKLKK